MGGGSRGAGADGGERKATAVSGGRLEAMSAAGGCRGCALAEGGRRGYRRQAVAGGQVRAARLWASGEEASSIDCLG